MLFYKYKVINKISNSPTFICVLLKIYVLRYFANKMLDCIITLYMKTSHYIYTIHIVDLVQDVTKDNK